MNFHHESLENVLAEMNTIEDTGLASSEVKKRAEQYGKNKLQEKKKRSMLARFFIYHVFGASLVGSNNYNGIVPRNRSEYFGKI